MAAGLPELSELVSIAGVHEPGEVSAAVAPSLPKFFVAILSAGVGFSRGRS